MSVPAVREASTALPTGTVTFLFTDIEGSTRLLKSLGRDRYGDVLATHNRLLRAAFSEGGGIEIDTKGDSFFVVFRSAGTAITAAGAAQAVLASHEWPEGIALRVRMGLHTGEANVGSDGSVGYAVHQAARIGDAGHGGQVLLSSTTASLVRHDLPSELGLRDLGRGRACRTSTGPSGSTSSRSSAFRASSRRSRRASARRPGRESRAGAPEVPVATTPLLEREAELAAHERRGGRGASGAGRVVAIEGRAGMGKTRLVAEARALAAETGFEVLVARSADLEQEFAYGVVRQLFEPFLASLPPEEREEALSGTAGLAERLFGDEELTGAASGDVSFAVLHGLYWLAANLAAHSPTAIVIDDLHWTDAPTLRWLTYLARRLEGLPLLVVLGLRPPEQSVETELLTELIADPTGAGDPADRARRALGRLAGPATEFGSRAGAAEFVGGVPRGDRRQPALRAGAPRRAPRRGRRADAENARRVREIGPEPVTRAVTLRLSRLPTEARRLAVAVAVLGDGAELATWRRVAGLEDSQLATLAADRARAGRAAARDDADGRVRRTRWCAPLCTSRSSRRNGCSPTGKPRSCSRAAAQSPSGWPRTSTWCHLRETRSWWTRCAWPRTGRSFAARPRSRSATCGARWPSRRRRRRAWTRSPSSAWPSSASTSSRRPSTSQRRSSRSTSRCATPGSRSQLGRSLFRLNRGPEAVTRLRARRSSGWRARSRSCGRCWKRS